MEEEVTLKLKVNPKADKNRIRGIYNNILSMDIKAVAEKGKANQELIKFLSSELKVSKNKIKIVSGIKSRIKLVKIKGLRRKELEGWITERV